MKNIGILGIGAIGSVISKYIIGNPANNYFFFNRSEKNSIQIEHKNGLADIHIELSPTSDQNLDWLIVCLKKYHVPEAFPVLEKLIKENTKVAIFQNGINLSTPYLSIASADNFLETIIDCPVQKNQEGIFQQLKNPKIILPEKELSNEFISLFKNSEVEFKTTDKFAKAQWTKLIESSATGSIQAYTRQDCSIFKKVKYIAEFKQLVEEGIAVAICENVELDVNLKETLINKLKDYPSTKGSSMLSDKLAGKKLELDAKIGAILKIAHRNNLAVPNTERIYNLLSS